MRNHFKTILRASLRIVFLALTTVTAAQTAKDYCKDAKKGDAEAMYRLGICFYEGSNGVKMSAKDAKEWIEQSADKGYAEAEAWMANSYRLGLVTDIDGAKCQKYAKLASNHGNAFGTYLVAVCLRDGLGCAENKFTYLLTLSRAANAGNAEAQCEIGELYAWGSNAYNVRDNHKTALSWFEKAAQQGFTKGQTDIGVMTEHGWGCNANENEAVKIYQKSYNDGDANAAYQLWRCYYNGIGVAQDKKEAFEYLKKGADLSDDYALATMALEYYHGENTDHDRQKSLDLLNRAASMGNPIAYAILGHIHVGEEGTANSNSKDMAFSYLSRAIKFTERLPHDILAVTYRDIATCYQNGIGTPPDVNIAKSYMSKADNLGNIKSNGLYVLGAEEKTEKTEINTGDKNTDNTQKESKLNNKEDHIYHFEGCYFKKNGSKWIQHSKYTNLDFEYYLDKEDSDYYYLTSKTTKDFKYRISKSIDDDCYKLEKGEYVVAYRRPKQTK